MNHNGLDFGQTQVEITLGHEFLAPDLLMSALTRRSFWHEHRDICEEHNERMEFLGDAILGLIVADILYGKFPKDEEGDLQKRRASLVNRGALAQLMRQLDLARFIRMGRGDEMSGCRERDSILADTLEALVAAVYLDGGFNAARRMIARLFGPLIEAMPSREEIEDYKSRFQERVQADLGITPHYEVMDEWGEEHEKTFKVAVFLSSLIAGLGVGRSKKEAAQAAAHAALQSLAAGDIEQSG
ncbi:MAG: ribonuclease III [Deltaproteobacteria bacterium]|nr:ribonuclease III [Deltaproteobacteria bacterium]